MQGFRTPYKLTSEQKEYLGHLRRRRHSDMLHLRNCMIYFETETGLDVCINAHRDLASARSYLKSLRKIYEVADMINANVWVEGKRNGIRDCRKVCLETHDGKVIKAHKNVLRWLLVGAANYDREYCFS